MADLSKEAVILACEANEEDITPSRILVHHFEQSIHELFHAREFDSRRFLHVKHNHLFVRL